MSYILDALKRAESERERGVVPGLLSQSVPLRRPVADARAVAKPLMFAAAAVGLAIVGVLAWRSLSPVATGISPPAVAVRPPVTTQVMAATSAVAAPASPPMAAPAPIATAVQSQQSDKPAAQAATPKPEPRQEPKPTPAAPALPTPAPANPRIMPIGELPADIRQTLPKVVISGSTYSDNPAYRMLIINGEVFREGEKPAPDLQLEQIRAKAAVLNFKGLRYSVGY
jgi:general secretion pathway protein B